MHFYFSNMIERYQGASEVAIQEFLFNVNETSPDRDSDLRRIRRDFIISKTHLSAEAFPEMVENIAKKWRQGLLGQKEISPVSESH